MDGKTDRMILGCDIGNGFGYVSVLTDPQADPIPLIPTRYSEIAKTGMPTTAYIAPPDGKNIDVFTNGKPAEVRYRRNPGQLVRAIKTCFADGTVNVRQVNSPVDTGSVYAAIARDLVKLAHEDLADKGMKPACDVVFTFPASFAEKPVLLEKMEQSINSVEINGQHLHVCGRLPEPAAAAIDYLHYMQHIAPEGIRIQRDDFTVLVYDLGHGTFDAAVVTASSGEIPYTLHFNSGDPEVGGKDFDRVLMDEIMNLLEEESDYVPKTDGEMDEVRRAAVECKHALTDDESYTVTIRSREDDGFYELDITRERFEELSEGLIYRTLTIVSELLEQAETNNIKIDAVVLSGGGSRMPMVRKSLEAVVEGRYPVTLYRPSEAVSYGAARYAATRVIDQLTDCCYGIWMPSSEKLEGEVQFCIPCGAKRPARSRTMTFRADDARYSVKVYRAAQKNKNLETCSPNDDENCRAVLFIPFDLTPGALCNVTLTAMENYDIQVDLKTDNGEHYTKRTSDALSKIL